MSWIDEIQGLTTVRNAAGVALPRRSTIQFGGIAVTDDGTQTLVGGAAPASITGTLAMANLAAQNVVINSIVAALVAKGIVTDNRV